MTPPEHRVSELNASTMFWRIRVKILRKWFEYSRRSRRTMEMVFCDDQGSMIHAIVSKRHIHLFDDMFEEMQWRIVQFFKVDIS
ncbi:unnamed protein product [Arabis nemorensis]|uniref:Replication protein A 70 kDa DNA-binding subunit B/D first OB fold domain-containing protein n=1 Tax=Arabis nemorensis TaxID=586526 RepID=A0A565BBH0_9BRAS|nr:unnamed protein product [Arabis nemorensis]